MTGDARDRAEESSAAGDDPRDRLDEEWADFLRPPPRKRTFSLRTMFFIMTSAAIFFCGARIAGPEGTPVALGGLFLASFLCFWSFIRRDCPVRPGIFFVIAVLFAGLCLPMVVQYSHRDSRRLQSMYQLKEIGQAIELYEMENAGTLPRIVVGGTPGNPYYSWRGEILTQVGRKDLQANLKVNEPWNGPANREISNVPMSIYHSPQDQSPGTMASYLAVVGPRTAFPGPSGLPTVRSRVTVDYIAKHCDPKKLIIVIELPNSGINWLEPRDLSVEDLKRSGLSGLGTAPYAEGFNVLFADGHVETLPADIPPAVLAKMLEIDPDAKRDN